MMKLVLVSRNTKKIEELRTILCKELENVELLSPDDVGITDDVEETGTTFEENALIKARVAASKGYIGLADDSGLAMDALNGAPGVFSARYAAKCQFAGDHDDEGNNRCLLYHLQNVPDEQRTAAYVCAIACVFPDGRSFTVRGEVKGKILRDYHGTGGFGYDPLFYYEPFRKTFAEVTAAEKHAVSHRGTAMRELVKKLKEWKAV